MSVIKLVLYDSQVKIVDKLVTLGSLSALAITVDSYNLVEISYYAQRLIALSQTKSNVLTAIVDKAKYLPEYDIYLSVPGFSDKTVVSITNMVNLFVIFLIVIWVFPYFGQWVYAW